MKRGSRRKSADRVQPNVMVPMTMRQRLAVFSGAVVIAAAIISAGMNFAREMSIAFTWSNQRQIPPLLHQQLAEVRRVAPLGSRFIWLNRQPDYWFSRIWQRMLYPDPLFVVENESELETVFVDFKRRYDVSFVFSAGSPPLDPGYAWVSSLQPPVGMTGELWFGELRAEGAADVSVGIAGEALP